MTAHASPGAVLVTGATGLIGGSVLARLLEAHPRLHGWALVRSPDRGSARAVELGVAGAQIRALAGDVTRPGLGLAAADRARLGNVRTILHCAGDVSFSRPLPAARAVNRDGTRNVLELAAELGVERVVHMSTAFVCGCVTGFVADDAYDAAGWVNAYEQSKHEAEALVRDFPGSWLILRPSAVACDGLHGGITQVNSVHRSLRLMHAGLASMLPGDEDTPVDMVTTDFVARAAAALALRDDVSGHAVHLCAGAGALPLGELLDRCFARWHRDRAWRRRGVARPALTDLRTYRLFEASAHEVGDDRLRAVTRSLAHFVPQLALPKRFDTRMLESLAGVRAPAVAAYWDALLEHLPAVRRAAVPQAA